MIKILILGSSVLAQYNIGTSAIKSLQSMSNRLVASMDSPPSDLYSAPQSQAIMSQWIDALAPTRETLASSPSPPVFTPETISPCQVHQ